ncbi:MAG TPA: hypothetical protein VK204_07635, partial [Nocardioidaceae bacterium]|nr:hypothetical protein [Nocardioidaceae bacterium]
MAGFVLLALVVGVVTYRAFGRQVIVPAATEKSYGTETLSRADEANRLLLRLKSVLDNGTRKQAMALAAPGEPTARHDLGMIYDNVHDLRVADLSLRFIDDRPGELSDAERRTLGR